MSTQSHSTEPKPKKNRQTVKRERTEKRAAPIDVNNSRKTIRKQKSEQSKQTSKPSLRKEQKQKQKAEKRKNKRPKRRIFPIWLRLIIIPILFAIALILGLGFGYSVLGDGSFKDIFDWETWQHISDIVNKE